MDTYTSDDRLPVHVPETHADTSDDTLPPSCACMDVFGKRKTKTIRPCVKCGRTVCVRCSYKHSYYIRPRNVLQTTLVEYHCIPCEENGSDFEDVLRRRINFINPAVTESYKVIRRGLDVSRIRGVCFNRHAKSARSTK